MGRVKITEVSDMGFHILRVLWERYARCREGEELAPYLSYRKIAEDLECTHAPIVDELADANSEHNLRKKIFSFDLYFREMTRRGLIEEKVFEIPEGVPDRVVDGWDFLSEFEKDLIKNHEQYGVEVEEIRPFIVRLTIKGIDYCEGLFGRIYR